MTTDSPDGPAAASTEQPWVDAIIVDDHDAIRIGLAAVLAGRPDLGIRLVAHATDIADLRRILESVTCDVVILDLALGDGSDPADTVRWLIAAGHRVVIYSVADDPHLIRQALAAGAHGLSRKSDRMSATVATIREVAGGATQISLELLAMIDGDDAFVEASLSAREQEVLALYVSGLEVPQIAKELYISENSAKEYLRRVRAKYSEVARPAASKVELLRRAIEDGIVPPIRQL